MPLHITGRIFILAVGPRICSEAEIYYIPALTKLYLLNFQIDRQFQTLLFSHNL